MNFYEIVVTPGKNGIIEVSPDFQVGDRDSDLMVKGKAFSAIWDAENNIWSTDEHDVQKVVDKALMAKKVELENGGVTGIRIKTLRSYQTKKWDEYKSYVSKCPNQFRQLDDKLTFADTQIKRSDYASKRLGYSVKKADHTAYDEIMNTLYSEENRKKLEWAIGAVISGESKVIQKFIVLNGKAGTGKGTFLKVLKKLFEGYICDFSSKDLCNSNKDFRLEPFKDNPLVAVDEDGDLSRIEDATELNKIVSHERTQMNEKGKPHYPWTPHCMLFIASNEPVKIKNEESGLIRRLIDVYPTGKKISGKKYFILMERIDFELGGIAEHCLNVYKELGGKHAFDNYQPTQMIYRTNVFFNFIEDKYDELAGLEDGISLKTAYSVMWKQYCDDAGIDPNSYQRQKFREELKNYFEEFYEVTRVNGKQVRSWYSGFKLDCLHRQGDIPEDQDEQENWLTLKMQRSSLDEILKDCKAQYEVDGKPELPWDSVATTLKDLDTTRTHYVLPPEWLWMADFDIKNAEGEKDAELNLKAASKWPKTYAEVSKGGAGVHLYYRYSGDQDELMSKYGKDIEVKVFHGKAAIRRKVSKCNREGIATISSGLPKKEKKEKKAMVDISVVEYERYLINLIRKAIRTKNDPECKDPIPNCEHTKPCCDFIKHVLDEAYKSGKHYDVSQMRKSVYALAMGSTNNKRYCTDLVRKMKFYSEDVAPQMDGDHKGTIAFYDIEVFPNVNMVNWKVAESFRPDEFDSWRDYVQYYMQNHKPVVRLIIPKSEDINELLKYDLIGFNCRKYDNHILHAMRLGYSPQKVYETSSNIIAGNPDGYFRDAWDYSLTDIYDFSSKKQSLKKFEIDLGIHHKELGMDWTKPVPEEKWAEVAEYCDNDVLATEMLFWSPGRQADWTARQILADLAGLSVNSTTNTLTTKIIFGGDRNPQSQFNYRFMGTVDGETETYLIPPDDACGSKLDPEFTLFDAQHRPVFPGYSFEWVTKDEKGKKLEKGYYRSLYRGEEVGEGGYVYAEPGIYTNVALLDIASMHPSSIIAEQLFGPVYTKQYEDILKARIAIKHKQYDQAKELFDGKLAKYLDDPAQAKALSGALKIAINSVYGLTSARFDNPFRDNRNKDNIVAKRGALFMVNLKHEVQKRGFTVAHIKTDSIKIPNATKEIIQFVMDYGKLYGYNFEHEATYDRMCLITKADYVAKYMTKEQAEKQYGYVPGDLYDHGDEWTETGDWFMDSYLFKQLFTHEEITLEDMYEVNSVTTALYLDMNENLSKDEHNYIFVGKCGAFCPVREGCGGGLLVRQNGEKFDSANGAKGYRWKEYEVVKELGLEDQVDRSYYDKRTEAAKAEIEKFGPFEQFVSSMPYPVTMVTNKDTVAPFDM